MINIGDVAYEWVFLHVREMGNLVGLVPVPSDLIQDNVKADSPMNYKRAFAASILFPEKHDGTDSGIIELSRPHAIGIVAQGQSVSPLDWGDKKIFIKQDDIRTVQIMDETSKIVMSIRGKDSKMIVGPGVSG